MKKLLLGTAAVALGLALATPAKADGVKLGIGGYFKGYTAWIDSDEDTDIDLDGDTDENRQFDILRDTEVHFTGETTLDNGLTVGFHTELEDDAGNSFDVDETYAYFSGAWGRVNFGAEDGATYLLQVAAPSADSNYDGLRQFVNPVNYAFAPGAVGPALAALFGPVVGIPVDYANDLTASYDKLTYLTPVFSGFQGGVSYTPDVLDFGANVSRTFGVTTDDLEDEYGDAWEGALRWEGMLGDFGVALGGGYSHVELEQDADDDLEDLNSWNLGADLNWGAFGLGVAYLEEEDFATVDDTDASTWVVGLDYTTGPFKIGGSYLNMTNELEGLLGAGTDDLETDRWTGGVVYTYGPGMTFRGSVSFLDHEIDNDDMEATSVLLGTQIDF